MASFTMLLRDVRRCTICSEHLPLGPRPILQLHPHARVLVAGQAPGRKGHESGVPFADASGDRLREWLGLSSEVFYDPQRVAILPMGFCFPGTGKAGDHPPRPECAPEWRDRLLRHLSKSRMGGAQRNPSDHPDSLDSTLLHPACLLPVHPLQFRNDCLQGMVEFSRFLLRDEVPGTGH